GRWKIGVKPANLGSLNGARKAGSFAVPRLPVKIANPRPADKPKISDNQGPFAGTSRRAGAGRVVRPARPRGFRTRAGTSLARSEDTMRYSLCLLTAGWLAGGAAAAPPEQDAPRITPIAQTLQATPQETPAPRSWKLGDRIRSLFSPRPSEAR